MIPINEKIPPICRWRLEQEKQIEVHVNRTLNHTILSVVDTVFNHQYPSTSIVPAGFNFSECIYKEAQLKETRVFRNNPESNQCVVVRVRLRDRSIKSFIQNITPEISNDPPATYRKKWDRPSDLHAEEGMIRGNEEIIKIWPQNHLREFRLIQKTENDQLKLICKVYNKIIKNVCELEILNEDLPKDDIEQQKSYLIESSDVKITHRKSDHKKGVFFEAPSDETLTSRISDPLHPATETLMRWSSNLNSSLEVRIERVYRGYQFKVYDLDTVCQWPGSQLYTNTLDKCIWNSGLLREPSQEELNTPGYQNHQPFEVRVFRHKNDRANHTVAVCVGIKPCTQEIDIATIDHLECNDHTDLIFIWPERQNLSFVKAVERTDLSVVASNDIGICKNNESILKIWKNVTFDHSKDLQYVSKNEDEKHYFKLIDINDPSITIDVKEFSILDTPIDTLPFHEQRSLIFQCNIASIEYNKGGIPVSIQFSKRANDSKFGFFFSDRKDLRALNCEDITTKIRQNLRVKINDSEIRQVDEAYLQRAITERIMGYNFGEWYGGKKDCFHTVIERKHATLLSFPKGAWGFFKAILFKDGLEVQAMNEPNHEHNEGLANLALGDPSQSIEQKVKLIETMNACLASCSKFELYIDDDQANAIAYFDHKKFVISSVNVGRSIRNFAIDQPTQMVVRNLTNTLAHIPSSVPAWLRQSFLSRTAEYFNIINSENLSSERRDRVIEMANSYQSKLESKIN